MCGWCDPENCRPLKRQPIFATLASTIAAIRQLIDVAIAVLQKRAYARGLGRWLLIYAVAYVVGAGLDLWTTSAATSRGIAEGNTYTLNNGGYVPLRALEMNFAGGAVMLALWAAGIARADSVSRHWLDHSIASWGKLYVNPFARAVADRAPLHLVAWAVAFVIFRLLAAANNLLLIAGLGGPVGWAIFALAPKIGQTSAFILVVALWYVALAILASPVAAAVLRLRRQQTATSTSDL